jgi:hypothetical protein
MNQATSPYQAQAPSGRRLLVTSLIAAGGAALALVTVVLPAEYGIDPTGIGRVLGLTAMGEPSRTIEIVDVVGGNERVVEAEIPDFGEPVPLPNPAVHQDEPAPARSDTVEVVIPPEEETEVKLVLKTSKAVLYSWKVDRGTIYSDFHGHTPDAGPNFFVRYIEHQETEGGNGSLVAPFEGEHGWYWLNYNEFPVTVTLTVSGYHDDIIDYGIF